MVCSAGGSLDRTSGDASHDGPKRWQTFTVPKITPAMKPTAIVTDPTMLRDPTILRCWSCQRRVTVAAPRRGGCYHCPECSELMTVIDPSVGMTCSFDQAGERGLRINSEASEIDSYTEPELGETAE
jgi:hypothetical protein